MKKLLIGLCLLIGISATAQNRFPSVDSAKNYVLRYIKTSAVEAFSNYRMQNVQYGTLELLDSLIDNVISGKLDSIRISTDSLFQCKGGTCSLVGKFSTFISGGDTTIFEIVLDTTGQANRRVLYAKNQKIASDNAFLWDETNNKLVINNQNISVDGTGTKLFVNGRTTTSNLKIQSLTFSNDTTNRKLLVVDAQGNVYKSNWLGGGGGGGGSGTVTNVATGNGLTGGPITTTGTIEADTGILATKNFVQKRIQEGKDTIPTVARSSISLTTTGSSGAATYNNTTGVLNIPQYSGGSASLNNIGTGYDVAVQNTQNVKRLAFPKSVKGDSTATANTLTLQLDGDAASPGNNVFYGTNSSGTKGFYAPSGVASVQKGGYAQRVAISSPDSGAMFYQTDELEGLYTWTGGDWAYQPPAGWSASIVDFYEPVTGWPSYGLSSNSGGVGSGQNIINRISKSDGAYGMDSATLGTSSSGAVGITYQTNSNTNDSAYGVSYIAYYRIQFDTLSNATNSYRIILGTTSTLFNSGSSVGNAIFRYDSVALGDKWQWELRNAGGTTRINTGVTVQANTWYTLCINYNQPTRTFNAYINGTLVDSRAFVMTTSCYQNAWQMTKTAGTISRCIKLDKMYTLIKNH